VSQTPNASIDLAPGVLLGTEIATIVAAAGWVIRASPSPRRFRIASEKG